MSYERLVREFQEKYDQPVRKEPTKLHYNEAMKRVKWLQEELDEYKEALLYGTLEESAKELTDLLYVVLGAFNQQGFPVEKLLGDIHRSNMTKNGDLISGKLTKGNAYKPSDLSWLTSDDMEPCEICGQYAPLGFNTSEPHFCSHYCYTYVITGGNRCLTQYT